MKLIKRMIGWLVLANIMPLFVALLVYGTGGMKFWHMYAITLLLQIALCAALILLNYILWLLKWCFSD